jgi:hypothetical protein
VFSFRPPPTGMACGRDAENVNWPFAMTADSPDAVAMWEDRPQSPAKDPHYRGAQGASEKPMISEYSIKDEIFSILESWSGFDIIRNIMQRYSKLQIYIAGGVVRDVLLSEGSHPKDIDLFLNGPDVDQALDYLGRHGGLGTGPFGSPRWKPEDTVQYADVIPIARFLNGLWPCEDILDTLNQFDFTCNAVALDLASGEFFNPQNGVRDARRRVMRAIRFDYPDEPISPDSVLPRPAVLWFRLLHYAASRDLTLEPVTLSWLRDHRHFQLYQEPFVASVFPLHLDALSLLQEGSA